MKSTPPMWAKCSLNLYLCLKDLASKKSAGTHSLSESVICICLCWLDQLPTWLLLVHLSTPFSGAARHQGPAGLVSLGVCLLKIELQQAKLFSAGVSPDVFWNMDTQDLQSLLLFSCVAGMKGAKCAHTRTNCLSKHISSEPYEVYLSDTAGHWAHKVNNCWSSCPTNIANRNCLTCWVCQLWYPLHDLKGCKVDVIDLKTWAIQKWRSCMQKFISNLQDMTSHILFFQ